jgi:predicted GNAT family acetyltransferase
VTIAVVERDDIAGLYQNAGFRNALGYRTDHPRPDMIATVATRNGMIVGIAGASADCDMLWQIGVDVRASERGAGVGRALVSRLTEAVLDSGHVPFYSTMIANIRSQAAAYALGYWTAWTEMSAVDPKENG